MHCVSQHLIKIVKLNYNLIIKYKIELVQLKNVRKTSNQ